jgi:hypothetical protein
MTDARLRLFWHRAGPLAALTALVAAGGMSQGCGGSSGTSGAAGATGAGGTNPSTTTGSSTMSTSSSTGTGGLTSSTTSATGGAGTGGAGGASSLSISPSGAAALALDATPNPTGATIYFTAVDPTKGPGVFSVPADGSNMTPAVVHASNFAQGDFAAPFGIATSVDGTKLYIADPGATDATGTELFGAILTMPVAGATPTVLAGTAGYEERSLEVAEVSNADTVFFTGHDPANGKPGVFKILAAGGTVSVVAEGAPFVDPSGITIATDGTIYVVDTIATAAPGGQTANIIKVDTTNTATTFVTGLAVGYPAGTAISEDGKTLYVSGLDPTKYTDQLVQIVVATKTPGAPLTMGVAANTDAAGLHRAKAVNVFAWADSSAGASGGTVYTIK